MLLAALAALPSHAEASDRERVTALADRFVDEYQKNFPISFGFSGLPVKRSDGVDINSPADVARWHALMKEMAGELATIKPEAFAAEPEWVTWQFLDQAFRQDAATTVCRNELWSVSPLGWQSALSQVASIQPVGTDEARAQALSRWREFGPWFDREIANLKEGQRLGYSATEAAARSTLSQLDQMLAQKPERVAPDGSGVAQRRRRPSPPSGSRSSRGRCGRRSRAIAISCGTNTSPHARKSPSLEGMPDGRQCYRALVFATTTVDADPVALFDVAQKEVERERELAVGLGRKLFGDEGRPTGRSLVDMIRADPHERFASADEIRDFTQRTYERAEAAAGKMVLTPPVGKVVLEPFPEFQQATAPGGQYLPAADDGSRPGTYYYRNVTTDLVPHGAAERDPARDAAGPSPADRSSSPSTGARAITRSRGCCSSAGRARAGRRTPRTSPTRSGSTTRTATTSAAR